MTLLDKVLEVTKERADNYDNPLPNFLRIAILWSVWYGQPFTPLDVAFMMDLMKTAREIHSHSDDTLIDKVGYTLPVYERMDEAMKILGYEEGVEQFRIWKQSDTEDYIIANMWAVLKRWKANEAKQSKDKS